MAEAREQPTGEPRDGIDPLLLECLDASPGERTDRLGALRQTDAARAGRIERLLAVLDDFGFLAEPAEADAHLPERIGEFRILRLLGSGGMGVVYLAEHEGLGRRVALKVLHAGTARTPKARERFRREALAGSRLDHPGICTIYEVGDDEDVQWIAMRFVRGQTLEQRIARSREHGADCVQLGDQRVDGLRGIEAIVQFVERAASALHVAHEAGLVHRDVKPGNLMVTPDGEPVLLDFGLALVDDLATAGLTRTGDQLGTPLYMAPEQVAGEVAGRAADIHALGVVLYECLVLAPPFSAVNREHLFHQILRDDPPDPRRQNRVVPQDLWTVLQTALAKDQDRRYATAAAFAADLRAVRLQAPILARRTGPGQRLLRFVRRQPFVAAFLVFLSLVVGAFAILLAQRGDALTEAASALTKADASLLRATSVEQALRANEVGRTAPAKALAMALDAVAAQRNLDTGSALYSAVIRSRERLRLWHDHVVWCAHFSADGELLLTCSDDFTARLWRRDGNLVAVLPHDGPVRDCCFSSDGQLIATASADGTAALWDRTGRRLYQFVHAAAADNEPLALVEQVRFSPDGTRVLTCGSDLRLCLWNTATGALTGPVFQGHERELARSCRAAWSPDGASIASVAVNRKPGSGAVAVLVWRPGENAHAVVLRLPHRDGVNRLEFAADSHRLLTSSQDGCRVWNVRSADPPLVLEPGTLFNRAHFDAAGERILASTGNGRISVWDRSGRLLEQRRFPDLTIPTFAGTGSRVLTFGFDTSVRLLDAHLRDQIECWGHTEQIWNAELAPDGRQLASASWDHTARVFDVVDLRAPRLLGHTGRISALAALADGRIASVADDASLRLWNPTTATAAVFATDADRPWDLAVAPDQRRIAVITARGCTLHDTTAETRSQLLAGPAPDLRAGEFLADGRLVVGGLDQRLVCASGAGATAFARTRYNWTQALAHAPRRGLLAAAGWNGHVSVFDSTGELLLKWSAMPGPSGWIHALAFSHDERLLATAGSDQIVQLWDLTGLEEPPGPPRQLTGHTGRITSLAWAPSDLLLATASTDSTTRLWRTDHGDTIAVLHGHGVGSVNAVLFAGDGRSVWTAGDDGAIQAWPTDFEEVVAIAKARVAALDVGPGASAGRVVDAAITHGCTRLLHRIAWLIVNPGDGRTATELDLALRAAEHAVATSTSPGAEALQTLARVHFLRGDRSQAVTTQEMAVAAGQRSGDAERMAELARVLTQYRGASDAPAKR